jgi:hypothetical protein
VLGRRNRGTCATRCADDTAESKLITDAQRETMASHAVTGRPLRSAKTLFGASSLRLGTAIFAKR